MPKSKNNFSGSWFRRPKGRNSSGINLKTGPSRRSRITVIAAFVVAFAGFGSLALFYSHADTNVLVNGGFNNGSTGWNIYPGTGTNFAIYTTGTGGTNPYEGSGYGATNTAGAGGGIYQDVALKISTGDQYCATAEVATEGAGGGAGGVMALWMLGGSGNENSNVSFTNLPGNSAWTAERTCKTATGAHTSIRLQFYPTVGAPTLVMDAASVSATAIAPVAASDRLTAGASLTPGQQISSANGVYRVILQGDGNFVLYNTANKALWNSKTNGKGSTQAVMQGDGNLVVYAGSKAVWSSVTSGKGGTYAVIQNDGNFVIYTAAGSAVWSSGTAQAVATAPAPTPAAAGSSCTNGHWQTTGNGGGSTYLTCSGGKWVTAACASGTVAVPSNSNTGPCVSKAAAPTPTPAGVRTCLQAGGIGMQDGGVDECELPKTVINCIDHLFTTVNAKVPYGVDDCHVGGSGTDPLSDYQLCTALWADSRTLTVQISNGRCNATFVGGGSQSSYCDLADGVLYNVNDCYDF